MEIGSVNIKDCFHFQIMPLKRIWWLHNIAWLKFATYVRSDPLPYALQLLATILGKYYYPARMRKG